MRGKSSCCDVVEGNDIVFEGQSRDVTKRGRRVYCVVVA
jgi:hypothetical protein